MTDHQAPIGASRSLISLVESFLGSHSRRHLLYLEAAAHYWRPVYDVKEALLLSQPLPMQYTSLAGFVLSVSAGNRC